VEVIRRAWPRILNLFRQSSPQGAAFLEKAEPSALDSKVIVLQFCNAFNDVPLMMENELLLETGDLLGNFGQNILAVTPKQAWDSTIYDGKQYAVAHNVYDLNIWGDQYRKDWLDKGETFDQFVGETFYSQMLKSLRKTQGKTPYFNGGRGEEVFRGQLDQTLAQNMAKSDHGRFSSAMYDQFALQRR
jgi:ABC-type glycerol-3-phosphate transport system substrate-binding protein